MRLALALSGLLAALAIPAGAFAALPAGNIVTNGNAEAGPAATNMTDAPAPTSWQRLPNFTSVAYGSAGFPTVADSAQIGGGANFFSGGPDAGFGPQSAIVQDIDLSAFAADLDASNVNATLSADLGGSGSQSDSVSVSVAFVNADGSSGTGVLVLQPVTPADRGNATGFMHRTTCVTLNPGTRTAHVQVVAQSAGGSYNDGYADNISVTLSTTACPPPPAQLPAPSQPQPAATGNATPVSGTVLIKTPGSNQFQELAKASSIPVGSELDAQHGKVRLQTAANLTGKTQTGTFNGSRFVLQQKPARRPITDVLLSGGAFNKCKARRGRKVAAAARPKRRLFGRGRGRFRTRGRFASATVRGTVWTMTDQCNSTTVSVRQGTVIVRDFAKRRTVKLKARKSYTARRR